MKTSQSPGCITNVVNEIGQNEHIPDNIKKSVFVVIPKSQELPRVDCINLLLS